MLHRRQAVRLLSGALVLGGACKPQRAATSAEDPQLLQHVIQQQEERVARARADVARSERELEAVRLRRRLLRGAGRPDLANRLQFEEENIEQRLTGTRRTLVDEEDALAIYRRYGQQQDAHP